MLTHILYSELGVHCDGGRTQLGYHSAPVQIERQEDGLDSSLNLQAQL